MLVNPKVLSLGARGQDAVTLSFHRPKRNCRIVTHLVLVGSGESQATARRWVRGWAGAVDNAAHSKQWW